MWAPRGHHSQRNHDCAAWTLHCRVAALADTGTVRTTVTDFGRFRLSSCHGFSNPSPESELITGLSLSAAASQFGKVGDPVAAVSSVALSAAARASRGPSSRSDTTPVYYIRDSLYKMIIQGGVRMTLTSAPSAGRTLRGLGLLADTLHQAQAGPACSPWRGGQRRLTPMASL